MNVLRLIPILILFTLQACVSKEAADGLAPQAVGGGGGSVVQILGPSLSLISGNQNFSSTNVGSSSTLTITVANTGSDAAKVATAFLIGNDVVITTDLCSNRSVLPGQTCSVMLTFSPTTIASQVVALNLPFSGTLTSSSHQLSVSIGAVSSYAQPLIASAPSSWDFDQVTTGQTATKIFTISNSTAGVATFQAAVISGAGYAVTNDSCSGQTLGQSQLCTITTTFNPALPNSSLGQLTINFQDSMGIPSTKIVSLSGYGNVPQPTLTFSPSSYNFNNVATNTFGTYSITVSNNSAVPASTGNLTISGADFTLVANFCSNVVLTASANCSLTVKFMPSTTGVKSGSLSLPFTSAQGLSYTSTANLGGTGVLPTVNFAFNGFADTPATHYTGLVSTGVTLRWTAEPTASFYVITRTGGSTGTVVTPHIFPTSKNSYAISGLDPNATYQFKINAFDNYPVSDGNNNWLTVTTPGTTGAVFNGWADLASTGSVFTDISAVDDYQGKTGVNRVDRNLSPVTGFASSDIDVSNNTITFSNYYGLHNIFATGDKFRVYGTGSFFAPGASGDTVYLIKVSSSVYKLAASHADALSSTEIDLTSAGSGNFTLQPFGRVKFSWEPFTIAPSGTAASHNIYRSTTSGSGFTLIGNTTAHYFEDQFVNDETTYYYKVFPVLASVEIPTAVSVDSEIKVYVPPQNMIFAHRWIMNRETCTSTLGFTFSTGVDRADNYSCAFTWGQGYAPNATVPKNKWDIGYGMISDRWRRGCKVTAGLGPIENWESSVAPAGSVYVRGQWDHRYHQSCRQAGASDSWVEAPNSYRVNYPGYIPINTHDYGHSSTYNACQSISISGVTDGNGNNKLRLPRKHELIAMRPFNTAVHINKLSAGHALNVAAGIDMPLNGSCFSPGSDHGGSLPAGMTYADPVYSFDNGTISQLNTGNFINRNCMSNYGLSDYGGTGEMTSDQLLCGGSDGSCFGVASGIDDGANLMENFLFDGVMGQSIMPNNHWSNFLRGTFKIPMLGLSTVAEDSSLGSVTVPNFWGEAYFYSNTVTPIYVPNASVWNPRTMRDAWSAGIHNAPGNYRCVGVIP